MGIRDRIRSALEGAIGLLDSTRLPGEALSRHADPWKELIQGLRLDLHETAQPALICFDCSRLTVVDDPGHVVRSALLGVAPTCAACGSPINVWMNTLLAMTSDAGLAMATQVGARHTVIMYPLAVGQAATFDVRDKGVPKDATILRIRHSAAFADGLTVVDLDGTDTARAPDFVVRVLAVSLTNGGSSDAQIQTTVTWAYQDADDDGRRSLNRALLAMADGRLEEAIVPANVAVELTLNAVLGEHLRAIGVSNTRLKPFLTDAATYSHQLNVLLPVVLWGTGAPELHEHLRGVLNRLRDLRNGIGHRGRAKQPLTREVVGECVAGAVFGFHYMRLAGEFLSNRRNDFGSESQAAT